MKALDELVHPDAGLASVFLGHCKRFDMGIERKRPSNTPVGGWLSVMNSGHERGC
jgi:hypothetical protein